MKQHLRQKMLDIRNSMEREEVHKKSLEIKHRLYNTIEFKNARTILFYVSFKNEVDTIDMIKESIDASKRVLVPISILKDRDLFLSEIKSFHELEKGSYGILEPKKKFVRPVGENSVDLCIVPGVAFDLKGNRIGFGAGYYDKLLIRLNRECIKIGLAYEHQIVESIPIEEHDVKLDMIVTEERAFIFHKGDYI